MSQSFDPNPNAPPGSPYAASPGAPPAKKRSALPWILGILGVLLLIVLICCGGGYLLFQSGMKTFGEMAVAEVRDDLPRSPQIREHIGEVQSVEFDFAPADMGKFAEEHEGDAYFPFDIEGDKGSGRLYLKQSPNGQPDIDEAILVLPGGEEIPVTLDPEVEDPETPAAEPTAESEAGAESPQENPF